MQAKVNNASTGSLRTTLVVSITDHVGALDEVLQIIREHNINMSHIESRPSKTADWDYDFFIDLVTPNDTLVADVVKKLEPRVKTVKIVGTGGAKCTSYPAVGCSHFSLIYHIIV